VHQAPPPLSFSLSFYVSLFSLPLPLSLYSTCASPVVPICLSLPFAHSVRVDADVAVGVSVSLSSMFLSLVLREEGS
jgi:hypothetical protein